MLPYLLGRWCQVPVFGNFTLHRALNWTYSDSLKAFTTTIELEGQFEMVLVQVTITAASGGSSSAASRVATLFPYVDGTVDVVSPKLPGPGFTGSYRWAA